MERKEKARILVVDDEVKIQELLARHFRFSGYHVEVAGNGEEALEVLSRLCIEVVISDIRMPVMDGVDLLREIKKQYPMVHVIMMTGYVTMENLLAAMRHGADTCVFKPLNDFTELENAVDRAVENLQRWQAKLKALKKIAE